MAIITIFRGTHGGGKDLAESLLALMDQLCQPIQPHQHVVFRRPEREPHPVRVLFETRPGGTGVHVKETECPSPRGARSSGCACV